MATTPQNIIKLSTVQPDYALIVAQFDAVLPAQTAWQDMYYGATGQAVLRYIASVGNLDQYAIEHAYRESFRSARLDSSVMGQARLLGVRAPRRTPASLTCTLSVPPGTIRTIPAYSQMTVAGTLVFNRQAIVFDGSTTSLSDVVLYEGTITSFTLRSDGSQYQLFVSKDSNYSVSDLDVQVFINNVAVQVVQRPLWLYKDTPAVEDSTTPTGQLQLMFGDGTYGIQPSTGNAVVITYATTAGASGDNASLNGQNVTVNGISDVTGVTTSGLSGGTDQRPVGYFRQLSPQLFSAHDSATRKEEMSAVASSYPGVVDAQVLGQRDIAPADNRFMNLLAVSLLTTTGTMSAYEWDQFTKWFYQRINYPARAFRSDPQPILANIKADVYCQGTASDLNAVKADVVTALQSLFAARAGIINTNIYISDIINEITDSNSAIEYVDLITPQLPIISQIAPPTIALTPVPGVGVLPAGQYSYAVTVVTTQGESLASNFGSVYTTAAGGVQINWNPNTSTSLLGYKVYGRTAINSGLIASVGPGVTSFVDDGSIIPQQAAPVVSTAGLYYPKLGTLEINMFYTNRLLMSLTNPSGSM